MSLVCSRIAVEHLLAERVRRQHAGRVARVDAGLLDVLHDAADPDVLAVADRVDVDLDRVLQEAVEVDLALGPHPARGSRRARRPSRRSPSPGRPARSSGARAAGSRPRARRRAPRSASCAVAYGGAFAPISASSAWKRPRSSARSIESTLRAEQRHARLGEAGRELERRLAAELDDHALGLLDLDDPEHVLERQRLEVQAVGGVVVGRDRLRVAVDHHGVATGLAHGHRGVHAAVVELDALPDPVGSGAEDHHAGAVAATHLVARPRAPRPSSSTASRRRTRRRRCRRTCNSARPRTDARDAARAPAARARTRGR